jgi:hypothetical protein
MCRFVEGRRAIGACVNASYGVYYIGLGLRGIALDPGWENKIYLLRLSRCDPSMI